MTDFISKETTLNGNRHLSSLVTDLSLLNSRFERVHYGSSSHEWINSGSGILRI